MTLQSRLLSKSGAAFAIAAEGWPFYPSWRLTTYAVTVFLSAFTLWTCAVKAGEYEETSSSPRLSSVEALGRTLSRDVPPQPQFLPS